MKKIVVIGNSIAAIKAIEDIKSKDLESDVTIFTLEDNPPCNRSLLTDFIAKELEFDQIFYKPKSYYEENNIKLISDRKITRVNFKRKKIFTEEKETFDYDVLLIADSKQNKYPDIKGTNKTGVYGLKSGDEASQIVENLGLIDSVTVQISSLEGLKIVSAISKRDKEVFILVSKASEEALFDDELKGSLQSLTEETKVQFLFNEELDTILGDSDVKAIKLKSGKVIGTQMVIFEEVNPDLRIYKDSELKFSDRIKTDSQFRTNFEDVFAVDHAADATHQRSVKELLRQGKIVGGSIKGETVEVVNTAEAGQIEFLGATISYLGQVRAGDGNEALIQSDGEAKIYKKVVISGDYAIGAILINAEDDRDGIFRLIACACDVSEAKEAILSGSMPEANTQSTPNDTQPNENSEVTESEAEENLVSSDQPQQFP